MFCDEPTTGLDAAAAAAIMRFLAQAGENAWFFPPRSERALCVTPRYRALCRNVPSPRHRDLSRALPRGQVARDTRAAVVCTIHQPSAKVFEGFGDVLVLSAGRVRTGPPVGAAAHLARRPRVPTMDAAEFCMELSTLTSLTRRGRRARERERERESTSLYTCLGTFPPTRLLLLRPRLIRRRGRRALAASAAGAAAAARAGRAARGRAPPPPPPPPLARVVGVLARRQLARRDPALYAGRLVAFALCNCYFALMCAAARDRARAPPLVRIVARIRGLALRYIDSRSRVQAQVLNRMFLVMWCSLVPTVLGLVAVIALNVEFHALRREARDRRVPGAVGDEAQAPFASGARRHVPRLRVRRRAHAAAAAARWSRSRSRRSACRATSSRGCHAPAFATVAGLVALSVWVWEAIAQCLSAAFDNPLLGAVVFLGAWFESFLFCGMFLPIRDVIWPFRALCYVLPFRWSLPPMIHAEFIDAPPFAGARPCDAATEPACNARGFFCPADPARLQCYGADGADVLDSMGAQYDVLSSESELAPAVAILVAWAVYAKAAHALILGRKCALAAPPAPPAPDGA